MRHQAYAILALTTVAAVSGCDGNETDLGPLTSRIEALEAARSADQARIATLEAEKADLETRLAALEALGEAMHIDGNGDVVFEAVNVRIVNGEGASRCSGSACNGKGNLIIGYDETPRECTETGASCFQTLPGTCTCEEVADSERTGSHNIVVGPRNRYSGSAGLVVGESNAVRQELCSVLGGSFNQVSGAAGNVVVGGSENKITSGGAVILNGERNTAANTNSTILVGADQTTSGANEVIPPL